MPDHREQISRALSGDVTALGALYSETVATIFYSSLKITGTSYAAHLVTVRSYLLAFGNLGRLSHPEVFPVWLDRLSVYLAIFAARERYSGAELNEAKERLIAFLRDFHSMKDAEIAALLTLEEQAVSACTVRAEALNTDEFLIGKETVLGIWHDICNRTFTPLPGETAPAAAKPAAPSPAPVKTQPAPKPVPRAGAQTAAPSGAKAAAPKTPAQNSLRSAAEFRRKRGVHRSLRIGAAVLSLLLVAAAVYGALHARSPEERRTQREVSRLASTLSLQLSGQVGEIYPLSEDTYFVSINLGYGGVEGLVVQYELADNSIRLSSPGDANLSESELAKLTGERYMQVLYNPSGVGSGSAKAGALDALPGETPLPAAEVETPAPTKTPIQADGAQTDYSLVENGQDFSIMLRINCRNVDFTRPMTVILDSAISKAIGEAGGLQIVLNDAAHCITLSTEQMEALCSAYGSVTLRLIMRSERQYDITFYSESGRRLSELASSMTFTLPASGPLTYVFALYDSGTESRGGVYDKENETITFPVARSGVYELVGRETEIRDADEMDTATAQAAFFLASLEFMPPDEDGRFCPDKTMTRNEAASVIGRMFLATDPELHSDFSDVDLSDPAYDYISYGMASQVFTGLRDGTFRGAEEISREDLLTVCGRTLLFRLGLEVQEPDAPLSFDDWDELSDYARGPVSALVEYDILPAGGALRPADLATRGEIAVLLYRMYCVLYGYAA